MEQKQMNLIETLIKGRDSAQKLQNLRRQKVNLDGSGSIEDLLMDILGSFSGGLSMLSSCDSDEIFGFPASTVDLVPKVDGGKKPAPGVKERRGCYKRRRTADSRVKIRSTIQDAYQWRKYGQKEILNSKYPRCYFRCTHKSVHGCKALKQVQQLEDDPNMFHITYFGYHTCPSPNSFSQHGIVLDFEESKNHQNFSNNPSTITNVNIDPLVKQEVDSKAQSTDNMSDNISTANDDYSSHANFVWDINDHEILMDFDHEGSCESTMNFFNNGDDDLLTGMRLLDEGFL
ncbi:WRKY DNA-binding transcription factor 70-like [Rutidosis leptorrhynchoides]|uniref:WRKY DNA-binding transcription factor 70-like n=1 Tax=Rutidosis leptorrhynchoides TaxID=125765 RepID=UPI003A99ACE9